MKKKIIEAEEKKEAEVKAKKEEKEMIARLNATRNENIENAKKKGSALFHIRI